MIKFPALAPLLPPIFPVVVIASDGREGLHADWEARSRFKLCGGEPGLCDGCLDAVDGEVQGCMDRDSGSGMSEGWGRKERPRGRPPPARFVSRDTRWWSEHQVKLSVREREAAGSIHHRGSKKNMSRVVKAAPLIQTGAAIDPQVWIVSSSSVSRSVKHVPKNASITPLLLFL